MIARGMEQYLWQNEVRFKDYAQHVKRASQALKESSLKPFQQQDRPVTFCVRPR